ncbi:MAG: glycosyl transferase family 1 [Pirellulaceae bacterium]|nr:MAG: glycosyl transferase family 1 [Pirellulaceae bacterium]
MLRLSLTFWLIHRIVTLSPKTDDCTGSFPFTVAIGNKLMQQHGTQRKVFLVSNTTWNIFNFRRRLATSLREQGFQVSAVGERDAYTNRIQELGITWHEWKLRRRSINPAAELLAIWNLYQTYRRERPTLVHHFTVKAVLYGTIAATLAGVPAIVNSVTGLPYSLVHQDRGWRAHASRSIMRLYAWCLAGKNRRAIFQNQDDLQYMIGLRSDVERCAIVTPGSGVDLARFQPIDRAEWTCTVPNLVFIGRIIREKGIVEAIEAVEILRQRGYPVELTVCGSPDYGNRSAIPLEVFEQWQSRPYLHFLGHVEDIDAVFSKAYLVVLPSYREGAPRSLLEAAACGLPIVATDVPGCREVVEDGVNGLLVPPYSPDHLAAAIARLLDSPDEARAMGLAGRRRIETRFDESFVINATRRLYETLLQQ